MGIEWICPFGLGFLAGTIWMLFWTRGIDRWLSDETEESGW